MRRCGALRPRDVQGFRPARSRRYRRAADGRGAGRARRCIGEGGAPVPVTGDPDRNHRLRPGGRMLPCISRIAGAALISLSVLAAFNANAQADYPNKPIRLLIPFTPGGGTDFVSRVVATKLSETLKWQVVPENKPGASGNLAIAETARSAPDGYTIVMGQTDNMMLGPYLFANVGYDTVRSFVPIIQVSEAPLAIVSNAQPPGGQARLSSVADLVAKGKTSSGLTWATPGNGSTANVFGGHLKATAESKWLPG